MLLKVNVIRAKEFVVSTVEGHLDLGASKAMLEKIAMAAKGMGTYDLLIDLRQATVKMSTVNMWDLCVGLPESTKTVVERTAILIGQEEDARKAEFLKLCAANRGYSLNIFSHYEEAMNWLYTLVASEIEEKI